MRNALLFFWALLLLACASSYTGTMRPVINDLGMGQPVRAMERLRHVFPDSTGKDRLLYLMELGNLARYAGLMTQPRQLCFGPTGSATSRGERTSASRRLP